MEIRTYQPGDDAAQVAIYNEAAAALPRFKPASPQDVQRRVTAPDFDPSSRFYAVVAGQPVAYTTFGANGRVSYPWCRKGHEALAGPLFDHMLQALRQRGHRQAHAAYRADWTPVLDFLGQRGFAVAREMVNFVTDVADMPTAPARRGNPLGPLRRADVPALFALAGPVVRSATAAEFERHLFDNPYFPPGALFALRNRADASPVAAGILITNAAYADPKQVDSGMPCFRLGAFGTEGMQTKRIKGLFSFICAANASVGALGLDLMGHAGNLLQDTDDIGTLAGQVPSDAPHLLRFYQMNFRRQGSFPVLERTLATD